MIGERITADSLCCEGIKKGQEVASVHFMECVPSSDGVDDALGGVRPRWAAAESRENGSDVDGPREENNRTAAGE